MCIQDMQIDLEEFISQILKKWKMVVIITALSVGTFLITVLSFGERIEVPHSEEYLYYEDALERHLRYVDDSVLMKLDPTCFYEKTLFLRNIEDKELMENYVCSTEIWEDLKTDYVKKYLPELIVWEESEDKETIKVTLRHKTSQECEEWAEYLKEQINAYDDRVEVSIGFEKVLADEDVQLEQLRRYTRTDHIKGLLQEARAGYTIEISIPVTLITGVIFGVVLSIFIILIQSILKNMKRV